VIGLIVITKLDRTSSAWWKSNTTNNYGDITIRNTETSIGPRPMKVSPMPTEKAFLKNSNFHQFSNRLIEVSLADESVQFFL
jgi:hypothetical protein